MGCPPLLYSLTCTPTPSSLDHKFCSSGGTDPEARAHTNGRFALQVFEVYSEAKLCRGVLVVPNRRQPLRLYEDVAVVYILSSAMADRSSVKFDATVYFKENICSFGYVRKGAVLGRRKGAVLGRGFAKTPQFHALEHLALSSAVPFFLL